MAASCSAQDTPQRYAPSSRNDGLCLDDLSDDTADLVEDFTLEGALWQDDACIDMGSSDCALALLQRKALVKKSSDEFQETELIEKGTDGSPNSVRAKSPNIRHADANPDVILRDPFYISLLEQVTTVSGESLYQSVKDRPFPVGTGTMMLVGEEAQYWSTHYANDFPNTALFTWGSNRSEKLYVAIIGTSGLCTALGPTLAFIAQRLDYFVVCPQLASSPTTQESVMFGVSAVQWALNVSSFSQISLAGHSGGASAVPAATAVLLSKGISIDAMIMQHPGIVPYLNVPGCQHSFSSTSTEPAAVYCKDYFPSDLMSKVSSTKLLLITGAFCEWSKVQNSNWLSEYGCCYACESNPPVTSCPSMTFPSPPFRPAQAAVTCDEGCPDAGFLAHPGDCMVDTYSQPIQETYSSGFSGEYLSVESCGDHVYGCMLESGLQEEGLPFIVPFLRYIAFGDTTALDSLVHLNGTTRTCHAAKDPHGVCNYPDSPFTTFPNQQYLGEGNTIQNCSEAPKMHSQGPAAIVLA